MNLDFDLDDQGLDTLVSAELSIHPDCPAGTVLPLDGEFVELIGSSLAIDGSRIPEDKCTIDCEDDKLIVSSVPDVMFKLTTPVRIRNGVYKNSSLHTKEEHHVYNLCLNMDI